MALVRDFEHAGRKFKVSVNKSGAHFVGVVDIPGVPITTSARQVEAASEDGALRAAKARAEELIDRAGTTTTATAGARDEF